jgi:hypothetical protein
MVNYPTKLKFTIWKWSVLMQAKRMFRLVYEDDTASKYDLILNFTTEADINCLLDMLVNNSDFLKSSGIRL